MASLNKAMIIGNLTRDPETRTTPQGATVTTFSVATNMTWTDQSGQRQEKVEFHNVVAWRKLGEICATYLQKGKQVYIEGRLQTRDWTDQQGVRKYRTEIIAENMVMLGGPGGGGQGGPRPQAARPQQPAQAQNQGGYNDVPTIDSETPTGSNYGGGPDDEEEVKVEDIPF